MCSCNPPHRSRFEPRGCRAPFGCRNYGTHFFPLDHPPTHCPMGKNDTARGAIFFSARTSSYNLTMHMYVLEYVLEYVRTYVLRCVNVLSRSSSVSSFISKHDVCEGGSTSSSSRKLNSLVRSFALNDGDDQIFCMRSCTYHKLCALSLSNSFIVVNIGTKFGTKRGSKNGCVAVGSSAHTGKKWPKMNR